VIGKIGFFWAWVPKFEQKIKKNTFGSICYSIELLKLQYVFPRKFRPFFRRKRFQKKIGEI
jgi:hypothetical protein